MPQEHFKVMGCIICLTDSAEGVLECHLAVVLRAGIVVQVDVWVNLRNRGQYCVVLRLGVHAWQVGRVRLDDALEGGPAGSLPALS